MSISVFGGRDEDAGPFYACLKHFLPLDFPYETIQQQLTAKAAVSAALGGLNIHNEAWEAALSGFKTHMAEHLGTDFCIIHLPQFRVQKFDETQETKTWHTDRLITAGQAKERSVVVALSSPAINTQFETKHGVESCAHTAKGSASYFEKRAVHRTSDVSFETTRFLGMFSLILSPLVSEAAEREALRAWDERV